jgi:drug/metabolite transporter (DMT)-like permease
MKARKTSGGATDHVVVLGREKVIGVLCGLAVVALFSGFTLISRIGFSSSLTLPDIAALRFGVGGTLLLPLIARHGLSGLSWRQALTLAFLGGMGFALFAYSGFALAPAAHGAVLLHGTLPLSTFILGSRLLDQRSSRGAATGILLIAVGIAMMALDSMRTATGRQLLGDVFLLLASLCWSSYGIMARRLELPPARAAAVVAVLSMTCFLPVYVFLPGKALFQVNWQEVALQAVFQGIFIGAISIFVYTRAVSALGASETALFTAAVPCVTTLGAIPLLSEMPSTPAILGVAIVTAGMVVALQRQ